MGLGSSVVGVHCSWPNSDCVPPPPALWLALRARPKQAACSVSVWEETRRGEDGRRRDGLAALWGPLAALSFLEACQKSLLRTRPPRLALIGPSADASAIAQGATADGTGVG